MSKNIAIDGPAGAGKSTIAKLIAKKLGYIYVDTGAMYRAMALFLIRRNISPDDTERLEAACEEAEISIAFENGMQVVLLFDENVNGLIRTEEVSQMASKSSVNAKVRKKLVALQQSLAAKSDVVMDGRDIGTVVLPDAFLKIFLTASSEERAKRRYKELSDKGVDCNYDEILKDIVERDHRDTTRDNSPLVQAEDAIYLDSSDLSIEEVADKVIGLLNEKSEVTV